MPEAQCGQRVRELGQQLIELRARSDDLAEALDGTAVLPPSEAVLTELRTRIAEAIDTGTDAERKVLLQALVHNVSVTSRDHIEPFFRVPQTADATAVRAVSGLVSGRNVTQYEAVGGGGWRDGLTRSSAEGVISEACHSVWTSLSREPGVLLEPRQVGQIR